MFKSQTVFISEGRGETWCWSIGWGLKILQYITLTNAGKWSVFLLSRKVNISLLYKIRTASKNWSHTSANRGK